MSDTPETKTLYTTLREVNKTITHQQACEIADTYDKALYIIAKGCGQLSSRVTESIVKDLSNTTKTLLMCVEDSRSYYRVLRAVQHLIKALTDSRNIDLKANKDLHA